ncbi:MAG: CoA-binding protein, partial [Chitinophagaceae bacterium]
PNPERYSFLATRQLIAHGHPVVALGNREGMIDETPIVTGTPQPPDLDTVTIYLQAARQIPLYPYLLQLHPRRFIFNPGSENPAFYPMVRNLGIEVMEACTLVLLSTGQY